MSFFFSFLFPIRILFNKYNNKLQDDNGTCQGCPRPTRFAATRTEGRLTRAPPWLMMILSNETYYLSVQVSVSLLSTLWSPPDQRIGRLVRFPSFSLFFSLRSTHFQWRSPFLHPDLVEISSSSPRSGVDLAIFTQIGW